MARISLIYFQPLYGLCFGLYILNLTETRSPRDDEDYLRRHMCISLFQRQSQCWHYRRWPRTLAQTLPRRLIHHHEEHNSTVDQERQLQVPWSEISLPARADAMVLVTSRTVERVVFRPWVCQWMWGGADEWIHVGIDGTNEIIGWPASSSWSSSRVMSKLGAWCEQNGWYCWGHLENCAWYTLAIYMPLVGLRPCTCLFQKFLFPIHKQDWEYELWIVVFNCDLWECLLMEKESEIRDLGM